MDATEFVKKFSIKEAKRIVEYRDNHVKSAHVFKFNASCVDNEVINGGAYLYTKSYNDYSVSVDDLKQIVDAFEWVEKFGGLYEFKDEYMSRIENNECVSGMDKAIELVEKCK